MKTYSNVITLNKNSRGVYSIDTVLGCRGGTINNPNGCYGDCYAVRSAKLYGYDFSNAVTRSFKNESHRLNISRQIERIPLPFVRIGTMGDPSENWEHTVQICQGVRTQLNLFSGLKEIVIITKHWNKLTDQQLKTLSELNVCINTSVSALDEESNIKEMLYQYERIKPFCKSILRVVSCNFNTENETGLRLSKIQDSLFKHRNVIDTVFRPSKTNPLVTDGVINVRTEVFNGNKQLASKYNRKTYMGKCGTCKEMCGANFFK